MTEALVKLPSFAKLSDRVWRVLGLNPGKFTLQGTNTYLLGTGARKLLLDCGEGVPEYLDLLQKSLEEISPKAYISDIIISHMHFDHYGGLDGILALPKFKDIRVHRFVVDPASVAHHATSFHLENFPKNIDVHPLRDNQVLATDGATLRVLHTPGHTQDHCTFWLDEENALFTADCVLGQGTAVFEDLSQYMDGLRKLVSLNPGQLYPGHGPVVQDGTAKITEYITHRDAREKQILDLLSSPKKLTPHDSSVTSFSPMEIVQVLYKNYPESLHIPAAHSVVLHLLKLEKDGKAVWDDRPSPLARPDLNSSRWHRL
ncbi:putative metallo-beta-lactamase domain protein [Gongronella butleri]|nr:putative metallo-beta-lactamase domain protein [Gongronella butleri]